MDSYRRSKKEEIRLRKAKREQKAYIGSNTKKARRCYYP
jgi:hypothetical protein